MMAGRDLYMVLVDLEKAFDRVPREVIWWTLRRKGVLVREIKAIMEMYTNIETSVKVEYTRSESFDVKVGVHQGSILSPLLFALVINEVTKDIREGVVKEMLHADDIVLVGDNWEEVESRYTRWKKALQENKCNQDKRFLYKRKFCTNANAKVPLLCMWQRSGKELRAVYKMSTLGAQEVLWSSWKLNQRKILLAKNVSLVCYLKMKIK